MFNRLRPRKRYVPEVGTHAEFDYAKEKGKVVLCKTIEDKSERHAIIFMILQGDLKLTVHSVPDKNLIIQVFGRN